MIVHLEADSSRVPSNHRFALPHGLGNCEAESFPERLLQNDRRRPLQSVDRAVSVGGQKQHVYVGIVFRGGLDLFKDLRSFRIVRCSPPASTS